MTTDHEASRTLVKSQPELWAECSDAGALARHLGEFGEIRITRLDPETSVAWEGERISGTVRIEPAGWGTRVTLTATTEGMQPQEPEAVEPPGAEPPSHAPGIEGGLWRRVWGRFRGAPEQANAGLTTEPEPPASTEAAGPDAAALLSAALDSLGRAHHRPFSRG